MSMKVTCGEFVGLAYASDDELREFAEEILAENAKLRELVYDMLIDEEREHNDDSTFYEHVERANELGIEI